MARKKFKASRKLTVSESKETINGAPEAQNDVGGAEGTSGQSLPTVIQEVVSKSPPQNTVDKPCLCRRVDMKLLNLLLLVLFVSLAIWSLNVATHRPETTINMTYSVNQTFTNPTNPTLN
ncbi:hypothetical protein Btru_046117 [Bulinus truncatus]|nr:hypothetical protein Btru_046117 [Bulinus truncatus]